MPPKKTVRSESHIKEDQSKRNFENAIQPWYVLDWPQRDYGIDALVEITSTLDSDKGLRNENKYFLVQLKATDKLKSSGDFINFAVPVKKIINWTSSNIPVLFVLNHLSPNTFYYIWMDEGLLVSLEQVNRLWKQQSTITLKIPKSNTFENDFHEILKSHIIDYKRPLNKRIEVGQFFGLRERCINVVAEFENICAPFGFTSVTDSLSNFKVDIDQSIYRIAITGLARVGKSSIINTLLKKQVCPVGFFQTTTVPIQVIPDKDEYIQVLFKDGSKLNQPYSFDCINNFASQDHNENNNKNVKLVSLSVLNENLQRGISIYDIPGLNDPNDEIVSYSWAVANSANAIFYVIDACPAQNGGFIFQNIYKKHIIDLGQSPDKIFLIFNKADAVSPDKLILLKERVVTDLKKLNLYDKVSEKIYYITTIPGCERPDLDSVEKLEEDVWNFIINENKYGIFRLSLINQSIYQCTNDFTDLLKVRLLNNEKRGQLQDIIESIKGKMPQLGRDYIQRTKDFENYLTNFLENKKNKILNSLEKWFNAIPTNETFPSNIEIKQVLRSELNRTLEDGNREYILFVTRQKEFVDNWIEDHLKQLREMLSANAGQKIFDFKDVEEFETPQADLSSAFGMGFLAYFAAIFVAPPIAIGAGIFAFFGSLLLSSESIRAKKVSKTMAKSRDIYNNSFEKLTNTYLELVQEQSAHIEEYAEKKLTFFFTDISDQMGKLQNPLSNEEKANYAAAFSNIAIVQKKLLLLEVELLAYRL